MYQIIVQRAIPKSIAIPSTVKLKHWAKAALEKKIAAAEVTLRIVEKAEITQLNSTYRHKNKATNVLSFPFDMPQDVPMETPILGDIVFCADIIAEEAKHQHKTLSAHWAHMVVHGVLHLLGHDHEKDHEAEIMEAEEILILAQLGFNNPYHVMAKGELK